MKILFYLFICSLTIVGCKENKKVSSGPSVTITPVPEPVRYFPVTSYFKGQLADIIYDINPLKYNIVGKKTDSVWLKKEDIEKEFSPFLSPVIDTLNLVSFFKEEKFLDESVNAFTYTYSPIGQLPDSMQLQHWDVYADPQDGEIKRVYMVKKLSATNQQQLTWQADEKWCKIVNITTKADGTFIIDSEQKIIWHF